MIGSGNRFFRFAWVRQRLGAASLGCALLAGSIQAFPQQDSGSSSPSKAEAGLPDAPLSSALRQVPAVPAASGQIHGTIADREGTVYQGVRIELLRAGEVASNQTEPLASTASDANGRFLFENVPPGPFLLSVSSAGFATQTRPGTLAPGESLEVPPIALLLARTTAEVEVTASRQEVAQAQLKEEEQQRVFGILPNFYVVYAPHAAPLSTRQKFHLAWRSSIDPATFVFTGIFAGVEQATNTFGGYGQGASGYAKRYGAGYADGFIETMIGSALLPSLLKQDPRYFYKGTGTIRSRILYALANSIVCKGDNGHWQANYSGLLGGLASAGISNLYYPAADRNGLSLTFENLGFGIGGSAAQNLVQEFLIRRLTPKLPSYGAPNP